MAEGTPNPRHEEMSELLDACGLDKGLTDKLLAFFAEADPMAAIAVSTPLTIRKASENALTLEQAKTLLSAAKDERPLASISVPPVAPVPAQPPAVTASVPLGIPTGGVQVQHVDNTGKTAEIVPLETIGEQLGLTSGNEPMGCNKCNYNLTRHAKTNNISSVGEIKYCPNCNAHFVPPTQAYCYACGTKTTGVRCHRCGANQRADEVQIVLTLAARAQSPNMTGRPAIAQGKLLGGDDVYAAELLEQARREHWVSIYQQSGTLPVLDEGNTANKRRPSFRFEPDERNTF